MEKWPFLGKFDPPPLRKYTHLGAYGPARLHVFLNDDIFSPRDGPILTENQEKSSKIIENSQPSSYDISATTWS